MDALAKTEARNYLSAAGFFLIAAWFLLLIFSQLGSNPIGQPNDYLNLAIGIGLLIAATLLIALRKRDMIAILFFMMGFYQLFLVFTSFGVWNVLIQGFLVLAALVTLASRDKQKWLLFLIPLVMFIRGIISVCLGYNAALSAVFYGIVVVLCLYYAFCCASERLSLPGRKFLTADEQTDFKASGSVLGYMLFALVFAAWTVFNFAGGETVLPVESFKTIELLCGALLVFVAILLLAVGRMRFTPVMFLLMGTAAILALYSTGAMFIGIGILYLVIALFAILRTESRILPGIMFLFAAAVYFLIGALGAGVPMVAVGIANAGVAVIATYLSFVVYSQRRLPKF